MFYITKELFRNNFIYNYFELIRVFGVKDPIVDIKVVWRKIRFKFTPVK